MPEVKITEIKIPEGRFGEERRSEDIGKLMESITQFGVLEPILVQSDMTLIAGFRRLTACRALQRETIEVKFMGSLSEFEHRRIELEENVMRLNLNFIEEAKAIAELDRLKKIEDPTWTTDKTAQLVGKSRQTAYNAIRLDTAIQADPSLENSKTLVGALKTLDRKKQLEKRQKDVDLKRMGLMPSRMATIITGDAAELIKDIADESIDAIITNPPFGVDLSFKNPGKDDTTIYHDDEDYITDLVMGLTTEWYRVLKPDSWLISFFDVRKITYSKYVRQLAEAHPSLTARRALGLAGWLELAGFSYVTVVPLIWVKPNKTQGRPGDIDKGFIVAYEALVFAAKGNAKLMRQGRQNIFVYDTPLESERVHALQMPVDLTTELVSMVCIGGETVLDTFAGSGSIGLGALNRQCNFIGFELDPEFAKRGNMLLGEHLYASPGDEDESGSEGTS